MFRCIQNFIKIILILERFWKGYCNLAFGWNYCLDPIAIIHKLQVRKSLPFSSSSSFNFKNIYFFHAQLELDIFPDMRPLHISLNTTHTGCKPSSSISSFTHSLLVFLPQLAHLTPSPQLSTGHFSWTRPDLAKCWPDPRLPTQNLTRPATRAFPHMYSLWLNNYLLIS